jgi:K+ transport systems, NAD-binding component
MDADLLREAGIEDADAVVVATNGDNTNIVVGQVAQKRFGIDCVVVRVLDPAAPISTRRSGCGPSARPKTAIDTLTEAVRACELPIPQRTTA